MENEMRTNRSGRIWGGLFLVGIGVVLLANQLGAGLPGWIFSWPMMMIAIGVFVGLKHQFRGAAWIVLIVIGLIFLFDFISPDYSLRKYLWPIMIMLVGLVMILRPKSHRRWNSESGRYKNYGHHENEPLPMQHNQPEAERGYTHFEDARTINTSAGTASGEYLDSSAIFGGIRKPFFTKDFKGGEAVSVFGGHEIDLSKCDIQGTVQLELTQICGGTKLIVPNNWNIKSEVVAFFGGIEDKRHTDTATVDPNKILLLKGTSILGGIDIKSY